MFDLIIPFYNSKTLFDTLASIAYQTDTDIPIYLIDDCSDIDYSDVLDFYQKTLDIHYYKLEKNSGPAVARQFGIDHSSSPYVMFMDSDDVFSCPDAVIKVKDYLLDEHDMYVFNFAEEIPGGGVEFHENDRIWLHGKVYKREFLEKHSIRFNDTYKNEDNFFNQLCVLHEPDLCYYPECLYIYRSNPESVTRRDNYAYVFDGFPFYVYNISEAMRICKEDHCDENLISYLGYQVLVTIYFFIIGYIGQRDISEILKYAKSIYQMTDFSLLSDEYKDNSIRNEIQYVLDHGDFHTLLGNYSFDDYLKELGE